MKIWLDALRDPKLYGHPDAKWIKSAQGMFMLAISLESKNETDKVTEIHFDNDLGKGSPEGYYVFSRLEAILYSGGMKGLKKISVHSSSPAAVAKFMLAKEAFKRDFDIDIVRNPV